MKLSLDLFIRLMGLAAVSVIVSQIVYLIKRLTPFGRIDKNIRSSIIGVVFGGVAILGTEFGVDVGGAIANARDAAPLCAGLLFGAPAGIISGVIGGAWRWFAASAGDYSRLACSVSTCIAGVLAAILRVYMFDNKRPSALFGFAIGTVMETLHMTILFLTHLDDPEQAFAIVRICTLPMILCNGVSVMFAILLVYLCSNGIHRKEKRRRSILQMIQTPLLIAILLAFTAVSGMIYAIQTNSASRQTDELMTVNLESIRLDILNESDQELLSAAHSVANALDVFSEANLPQLCNSYGLSEIYVIDENGIIVRSSNGQYLGYDMNSDADLPEEERQSSRFMILLNEDVSEYVQECRPIALDSTQLRKYAGVSLKKGGFVQVSYDQDLFRSKLRNHIRILGDNRAVGETGYLVITDSDYRLISMDPAFDGKDLSEYGLRAWEIPVNQIYHTIINGKSIFIKTIESEGFHIIAILTDEEAFSSRDSMIYVYSYLEVLVFSLLFVIVYMIIKRGIVNKIHTVNKSLARIIGGNLDTTVDVHNSEEFSSLSDDINSTVDTLKRYIDEAEKRIDKELAFAKSIQSSALPSVFPAYPNQSDFDIYAAMHTAKEVGGDFYDFYYVDENKFAILIADVSGKGIPAALFMMRAKTTIKGLAESQMPVNEIFTEANEHLCEGNDLDMFVTAWMGIVDLKTGHVTFANAGHNPPVLCRKGKAPELLRSKPGMVLAGIPGMQYRLQEFDLAPGDRILLYTDGVTEATNSAKELYGEERLLRFTEENIGRTADDILHRLKKNIDRFVGDAEQFDDITMLMFDYLEKKQKLKERVFPAEIAALDDAMDYINAEMETADVTPKATMQIDMSFEEMFVNVAHYAYPEETGTVKVGIGVTNEAVTLQLTDAGIPFNPLEREDPDVTAAAEDRTIGGLGIFMVKKSMDDVRYERINDTNVFTMTKYLGGKAQ